MPCIGRSIRLNSAIIVNIITTKAIIDNITITQAVICTDAFTSVELIAVNDHHVSEPACIGV